MQISRNTVIRHGGARRRSTAEDVCNCFCADRDIDLADAALIWLANASGQHRILTVDERDFPACRFKQGRRFELVKWS